MKCVATVPAYFSRQQIDVTVSAIEESGFQVLDVIEESTAAALKNGLESFDCQKEKKILVFDFGGGTLDLTIISVLRKTLTILAIDGDDHLGG